MTKYPMKTFKKYFLESTISVPIPTISPLIDYIKRIYEDMALSGAKALRKKEDVFVIDFTGTKYEFLNEVAKKYPLTLKLSYANQNTSSQHYESWAQRIQLNIAYLHEAFNTLKHEMVHYIQDLINKNLGKENVAGAQKRKLMSKTHDYLGYPKGKRGYKRTKHAYRPVEHHSNMVSNLAWLYKLEHDHIDMSKREIFDEMVKASRRLKSFKQYDYGKYKNYIKNLYTAFMVTDSKDEVNVHKELAEVIKAAKEIKDIKKQEDDKTKTPITYGYKNWRTKEIIPIYEDDFSAPSLSVSSYDYMNFSDLEDDNTSEAENIFDRLPYTTEYTDRDGYYYMRIPVN